MQNVMKIRKLRKWAGLTVRQLAAAMGVHSQVTKAWECETYLPHARDLPHLARALGCKIDDLYEEET